MDVGPPALEGPRDPELGETTGRPCDLATALQYLAILVAAKHRGGLPRSPSAGRCWEDALEGTEGSGFQGKKQLDSKKGTD